MASVLKNGSFKNVVSRSYSAQAAVSAKPASHALNVSLKPEFSSVNGIPVASIENNSPVTTLAILFKSGPRYEDASNAGVSHALRAFSGFATKSFSSFGVTRHIQQMGGNLFCHTGREYMLYGVSVLRDHITDSFKILRECSTSHAFKHWEVDRHQNRLLADLVIRDGPTKAMEMLHEAAYRNTGLGNSIFMPEYRNGRFTTDELSKFMSETHALGRMSFVGVGLDHHTMSVWAKKIKANESEGGNDAPTKYEGGEIRHQNNDSLAYVALAGAGAKLGSHEAASLAVAANILWSNHGVKNLPATANKLNKFSTAIAAAGGSGYAVPLNINYSDSGLFGFMLVEEAGKAAEVTRAVANVIKTLKITDEDVKQGVLKAKSSLLASTESTPDKVEDMGVQALYLHDYTSPENFSALDSVTKSSVQSAISTMLKSKPSMAAYGGVAKVPYIDQL